MPPQMSSFLDDFYSAVTRVSASVRVTCYWSICRREDSNIWMGAPMAEMAMAEMGGAQFCACQDGH